MKNTMGMFLIIYFCSISFSSSAQTEKTEGEIRLVVSYISVYQKEIIPYEIIISGQDWYIRMPFDYFMEKNGGNMMKAKEEAVIAFSFEFMNMKNSSVRFATVKFNSWYPVSKNEFAVAHLIKYLGDGEFLTTISINEIPLTEDEIFNYIKTKKWSNIET